MIEIKHLNKHFKNHCVFEDANLKLDKENSINCIIGASGSGKTTLFQILFGLDTEYSGTYYIRHKNAKEVTINEWRELRTNYIQIVYQDFKLLENFTVYENMFFAANEQSDEVHTHITEILNDMKIAHIQHSKVSNISGGEKQRLAMARALLLNPHIILLDEPTGNLDDENTKVLMLQIRKLANRGVMILIISHDHRVIPFCDNTFLIENKKIIQQSHTPLINNINIDTLPPSPSKKKKVSSFSYVRKRMNANKIDLLIANLPIIVIFIVFITIFSLIYSKSIEATNRFYGGIKEDVIVVSSSNYTEAYIKELDDQHMGAFNDGVRICFSQADIETVLKMDGVKDARLFNGSVISSFDAEQYFLDVKMKKTELSPSVKAQSYYPRIPDTLSFTFTSLTIPSEFIHSYNPKQIEIISGDFPSDDTEILLPDLLAYHYMDELGVTSLASLQKQTIPFHVHKQTYEDSVKNYVISGVYKTRLDSTTNNEISIYVKYQQFDFLDLFSTNQAYEEIKREYMSVNGTHIGSVYETYETYIEALGTNLGDLIIQLEKPEDVVQVTQEVTNLFPNLKQVSQYQFQHGDFKESYQRMIREIFSMITLIATSFGFVIVFINKNYIKNRSKEMAILYSLGYSKSNVIRIIIYEYLLSTIGNYALAYTFLFLAFKLYIESTTFYSLMLTILNFNVCCLGFLFIIIMTVISVLFSIHGVKQKNLKRYLR